MSTQRREMYCPRGIGKTSAAIADWNLRVPVGTAVIVRQDDGTDVASKTRSPAWLMCGVPVVMYEGRAGGYLLSRVRVATTADVQSGGS